MTKPQAILLSLFIVSVGHIIENPYIILLAEIALGIGSFYSDLRKGFHNLSFISFYSLFILVYLLANSLVILSIGGPDESSYNYYLVNENIFTSLLITYVGSLGIIIGYEVLQKYKFNPPAFLKLELKASETWLTYLAVAIILNFLLALLGVFYFQILNFAAPFVVFFIVRYAAARNNIKLLRLALIISILSAYYAFLFSFRRQEIFMSFFFYIFAYVIEKGTLRSLTHSFLLPIHICTLIGILVFPILGKIRMNTQGTNRIETVWRSFDHEDEDQIMDEDDPEKGSFLGRNSNLNQLTQVVKLANEDGFYYGKTIEYMTYAFIPRFVWPEKPLIMQGRWFALKTGLAYNHGNKNTLSQVNNSINMTTPGELYLNFSFIGTFIGMFMIGMMMNYLWNLTNFWDSNNLLGSIWSGYLLMVGFFYMNVDLQFIVSLLSFLFTLVIINLVIKKLI